MSRAFVSKYNLKKSDVHPKGIEVIPLGRIEELVKALFGRSSGRQQQADS